MLSEQHEERVQLLETLATLSGYTLCDLADRLVPDVVAVSVKSRALFVGDAKATETPSCTDTSRRLRNYAQHFRPWINAGFTVCFAICHDDADHAGWRQLLERAITAFAMTPTGGGHLAIGPGVGITWLVTAQHRTGVHTKAS